MHKEAKASKYAWMTTEPKRHNDTSHVQERMKWPGGGLVVSYRIMLTLSKW